jgi:hypothetical protein
MVLISSLGRVAAMIGLFAFYAIVLPLGVMYVVLCICRFIPLTGRHNPK